MHLNGLDLFSLSNFSKILLMDTLKILSLGTPWKNYIEWCNLCFMKHTAIFKEHVYGGFCEWKPVIKLSKILATMKHYKKALRMKPLLRN